MPSPRLQPLIRSNKSAEIIALLTRHYPHIYRIAVVLSGDANIVRDVTRAILRKSLNALPRWTAESDAARWFAHHTVLTVRQSTQGKPASDDPLLATTDDPLFLTLIESIRSLPVQQREAFLLHHGEGFDLRQMATAMDCSSEAAVNHLLAAVETLRPIAEGRLEEFTTALPQMLAQLLPPADKITLQIQSAARRHVWPRRLMRWIGWPLIWIAMAWIAWKAWQFAHMITL